MPTHKGHKGMPKMPGHMMPDKKMDKEMGKHMPKPKKGGKK